MRPDYLRRNVVEQPMTTKQKIGMGFMIAIVLVGFIINAHLEYVVLVAK